MTITGKKIGISNAVLTVYTGLIPAQHILFAVLQLKEYVLDLDTLAHGVCGGSQDTVRTNIPTMIIALKGGCGN